MGPCQYVRKCKNKEIKSRPWDCGREDVFLKKKGNMFDLDSICQCSPLMVDGNRVPINESCERFTHIVNKGTSFEYKLSRPFFVSDDPENLNQCRFEATCKKNGESVKVSKKLPRGTKWSIRMSPGFKAFKNREKSTVAGVVSAEGDSAKGDFVWEKKTDSTKLCQS